MKSTYQFLLDCEELVLKELKHGRESKVLELKKWILLFKMFHYVMYTN